VLAAIFLHFAFDDWKLIVKRMNVAVDLHNSNKSKKGELLLWTESNGHNQGEEAEVWESMISKPRFDQYMKHYRFKDLRHFLPLLFQREKLKEKGDPWWQF
jgi:hypothetical protein